MNDHLLLFSKNQFEERNPSYSMQKGLTHILYQFLKRSQL
ncbi:hypothetical protein CHCC20375_2602 [Bacillus licheniformis]|nr:hypothetical protein CHCC20375_2602 [Bacillus licheniformis]